MAAKQRSSRKSPGITKQTLKADSQPNSERETIQLGPRIDWRRIFTRLLMIIGIMIVVYFSKANKMVPFATQKEEISKRSVEIGCSKDYAEELKHFPGCTPRKCGRVVLDTLVSPSEVAALLNIAERGLSMGGSTGGASILDLHSGALSHGNAFVNIYKLEEAKTLFTIQDFKIYRITPAPPQTIHDEYWHPHVDKETYESFHYTSLLYLTDYRYHFDGGRFIFIDKDSNKTVEPRAGRVSAFTSGSENLHYVERVTNGTRYAITVSFTCDQRHAINDPMLRK
ncbi:2-oxoglutarate and iron-dependent oxygenase domain-containing protein 3 isoform X2 [Cherax quadricarinatus]|uniref:2-oxoglutarate and iron-dependent oxygenase domain-containing protein 3 isoform X2 n=1 Tax=Cherax quadricarinatus TaxID=27406 RepID=UPI00387EDADD